MVVSPIKPFGAVIYNPEKIRDYSKVVCPPYDIISPAQQERLLKKDPHNLIHILLGRDVAGEDKYERAAVYFRQWLEEKVLIQEERPAIYFYSQQYHLKGERRTRLGFISLLRLDNRRSAVFGHEHTRLEPKEDRLRLLRQVQANLSPIFAVFKDKKRIIQYVWQNCIRDKAPFIEVTDEEAVIHKLWQVDKEGVLLKMQAALQEESIFIADGHHRYEVACAFREEMLQKSGPLTGEEDFNYILSYFTNTDPRSLAILPIHRLLRLEAKPDAGAFRDKLKDYFGVEEVKDKTRLFFLLEKSGRTGEHVLGMYLDKRYWLLRLKNIKILDKVAGDKPKEYRSLDVFILNHIIFSKILGLDPENLTDSTNLSFYPSTQECITQAEDRSIAFFLNPVTIEQIISVALGGQRMPPKSTYFYPKVLSGLVINKFSV